jgi:hypothetical protein
MILQVETSKRWFDEALDLNLFMGNDGQLIRSQKVVMIAENTCFFASEPRMGETNRDKAELELGSVWGGEWELTQSGDVQESQNLAGEG